MVVKKQLKKISKKILVLGLATSIIFTSCFSTKKIEAHAASAAAALSAYTLYEICLYVGTLAVSALGVGYVYENRDEIAEFGKTIIDSMSDIPEQGWFFGSAQQDVNTVYGREALVQAQVAAWAYIVTGGQSPKNDNNNDDDDGDDGENGDNGESQEPLSDYEKRSKELGFINFFLTSAGVQLLGNTFKTIYQGWCNNEENNPLNDKFGIKNAPVFDGIYKQNENGEYVHTYLHNGYVYQIVSANKYFLYYYYDASVNRYAFGFARLNKTGQGVLYKDGVLVESLVRDWALEGPQDGTVPYADFPIVGSNEARELAKTEGTLTNIINYEQIYSNDNWMEDEQFWKNTLTDISTSLRNLEDLVALATELSDYALNNKPDVDYYNDLASYLSEQYAPSTDPITNPEYWPSTNTTPQLDPSLFPNYQPSTNPDSGETPDDPTQGGIGDMEFDSNGLLSLFNILFFLIMIIIMLIYLFLSCLAFIVMIFRIPASSTMLPDEMVMGFDHLKSIMIPGMNISIYSFAMALIYMFIIFTVIKILRLEINDFHIPRSWKKGG